MDEEGWVEGAVDAAVHATSHRNRTSVLACACMSGSGAGRINNLLPAHPPAMSQLAVRGRPVTG